MSRRRKHSGGRPGGGGPAVSGDILDPATGRPIRLIRGGENIQLGDMDADIADHQPVTATFRLKHPTEGVKTFRVNPDLTELTVIDLLDEANSVKQDDPQSMTMVKKYALEHVHPDDRDGFWRTVRAKGMDSAEVMLLCWRLLDGITANPTGGQSGSSDGQPVTSQSSPPVSSTPVVDPNDQLAVKRAAFLQHIDRIQSRTDEDGKVLPINAAVAAQLVVTARAQGIELDPSRSQAATA
jgi:hypothetical protein